MAKGQAKSNKEQKKPKKDLSLATEKPKLLEPTRTMLSTVIIPKGKTKK